MTEFDSVRKFDLVTGKPQEAATYRRGPWLQLFEQKGFEWNFIELPIANLPPGLTGFRVLHLTDLHLRPAWRNAYDELHRRIRSSPPDLLLITGDFVDDRHDHRPALGVVQKFLAGLQSRLGV